ncbi:MAG: phosphodiester glycosidase family protein [Armatimonadetes bacterium]|nr:phosphodiester glycosidase family protein [Armatimonadota bacterium]
MRFVIRLFIVIFLIHAWPLLPAGAQSLESQMVTVEMGGRRIVAKVIKAKMSQVRVKVGLAKGLVGRTEDLAGIARRYGAAAAINGSFFDAYTRSSIKSPHHTLITGGQVAHLGNVGTLTGFTPEGEAVMERVPLTIEGSREGRFTWPYRWYAYWVNRLPTASTVTIFTPQWGRATGLNGGTQVVVSGGRVERIARGSQPIPSDGYVIYFQGTGETMLRGFRVGQEAAYRIIRKDEGRLGLWAQVQEAVGAGPRLVADGRIALDPRSEGFSSPKILSLSGARSALGITRDNCLLMVTASGTVREMAVVMQALGAYQAMNLDGGASSGLWLQGRYLTRPGRLISNALLILRR